MVMATMVACASCGRLNPFDVRRCKCGFDDRDATPVLPGATAEAAVHAETGAAEPQPAEVSRDQRMRNELAGWGAGLILFGALHIVLSSLLDPTWGVMLIGVGVLTLAVRRAGMFIVIGLMLLLAGFGNLLAGPSLLFGGLQIYWGIQEMRKYGAYS